MKKVWKPKKRYLSTKRNNFIPAPSINMNSMVNLSANITPATPGLSVDSIVSSPSTLTIESDGAQFFFTKRGIFKVVGEQIEKVKIESDKQEEENNKRLLVNYLRAAHE